MKERDGGFVCFGARAVFDTHPPQPEGLLLHAATAGRRTLSMVGRQSHRGEQLPPIDIQRDSSLLYSGGATGGGVAFDDDGYDTRRICVSNEASHLLAVAALLKLQEKEKNLKRFAATCL